MSDIYEVSAAPHLPSEMKSAVQSNWRDELDFEGVTFGLDHELF